MKIDKDERVWIVKLVLSSMDCPHRYYPANIHACRLLEQVHAPDDRCRQELCPLFHVATPTPKL